MRRVPRRASMESRRALSHSECAHQHTAKATTHSRHETPRAAAAKRRIESGLPERYAVDALRPSDFRRGSDARSPGREPQLVCGSGSTRSPLCSCVDRPARQLCLSASRRVPANPQWACMRDDRCHAVVPRHFTLCVDAHRGDRARVRRAVPRPSPNRRVRPAGAAALQLPRSSRRCPCSSEARSAADRCLVFRIRASVRAAAAHSQRHRRQRAACVRQLPRLLSTCGRAAGQRLPVEMTRPARLFPSVHAVAQGRVRF